MRVLKFADWLEHGPLRYLVGIVGMVVFIAVWLGFFFLGHAVVGALAMAAEWVLRGGLA